MTQLDPTSQSRRESLERERPLPAVRVQEASRWFQARFELRTRARTEAFLAGAGLTPASCPRMRELATLDALERQHAAPCDPRLAALTRPRLARRPEDR